jgi:hypothetical protein
MTLPPVTDIEQARANPAVAVFAALYHGTDPTIDEMFPALAEALRTVDPKTAIAFYDIILAGLPMPARERWEAHVTTSVGHTYRSDPFRRRFADGEARGEARGEAQAILTVLDERGVAVPVEARDRILACTDLNQLTTWLRRAARANTIDDVLGA